MIINKINREKVIEDKKDFDILNMLNSISNFEVFTPYDVALNMVNLIPIEVFKDPSSRFLDPAVKSGIFLREIVYKLVEHLPNIKHNDSITGKTYDLSDPKQRVSHILRNMVYGIAISELTSYVSRRTLYGVMEANADKATEYLDSKIKAGVLKIDRSEEDHLDFNNFFDHTIFNTPDRVGYEREGNIFYPNDETTIANEDTHHPFINDTDHKFINLIKDGKMKFDVIIGNPPYQVNTNKNGAQARPIYNTFVEKALSLNPDYLTMIIPARWFSGGMGLNSFRDFMINQDKIREIVYFKNSNDCFNGVQIKGGICYFLYDKKHSGLCSFNDGEINIKRKLNQFKDVLISDNKSISIINKIGNVNNLSELFSSISPFGLPTNFNGGDENKNNFFDIKIYGTRKIFYINESEIKKQHKSFNKFKVLLPQASDGSGVYPISVLGKPILANPKEVCTATYIVSGFFNNKTEAENYITYIKSKFVRYLISLLKNTQHLSKSKVCLVPIQDFNEEWTDEKLYKKYNLTEEEINHIEESIRPME